MKVPALRIEVNGQLIAVAGAPGLSLLTGTVGLGSGQAPQIDASAIMFSVMGLAVTTTQPRQLTWGKEVKLKQGDRVTFQVVEVEDPSPPDQTISSPSASQLEAQARGRRVKGGSSP
jgi:hypothetical protein